MGICLIGGSDQGVSGSSRVEICQFYRPLKEEAWYAVPSCPPEPPHATPLRDFSPERPYAGTSVPRSAANETNDVRSPIMLATLRQRNFALLWTAGLISNAGDWVMFIGLPIYIFLLTHSI